MFASSLCDYQGLFGCVEADSESGKVSLHNINIINSYIEGYYYCGGIVGYINASVDVGVYNCNISDSEIYSDPQHIYAYIGGFIGYAGFPGVKINDCKSVNNEITTFCRSNISSQCYYYTGGIIGYSYRSNILNCETDGTIFLEHTARSSVDNIVGGIVGYVSGDTNIDNCKNFMNISRTREVYVYPSYTIGGIVGQVIGDGNKDDYYIDYDITILNCFNYGNIESGDIYKYGGSIAGGIIGSSTKGLEIINCCNQGDLLVSNGVVGGIVGSNGGGVQECCNYGNIKEYVISEETLITAGGIAGSNGGRIKNCYNTGNVEVAHWEAGGIVGSTSDGLVVNCYNIGFVCADRIVGGIAGEHYSGGADENLIANCCNVGALEGGDYKRGGLVANQDNLTGGQTNYAMIYFSYWLDSINENEATNNNEGVKDCGRCSVENVKDINWYLDSGNWHEDYPWDFENVWTFVEGMNDGYPILRGFSTKITYNSNTQPEEVVSESFSVGTTIVLAEADLFKRTGYNIKSWNTMADGSGVSYAPGATYTGSSITLYAVWEAKVIPVSLDTNGGSGGTSTIYLKYDSGWYSNSSCTSSITSITKPTRTGWTFNGYYTSKSGGAMLINSSGSITASDTYYSTDGTKTIYAQWKANNPAYYDSAGGYWYIENGYMPQKKVTDSTLISNINSSSDTGTTYYFAGEPMESKVYGGKEYCQYNNNWYEVMPIRWRLVYSSSQTSGYGTTTDTLAVMAEIVYVDAFSDSYLGAGAGYSSESVTEFMKNQIDSSCLVSESKSMPTFGSTSLNGTPASVSSNIFVASYDDLSNFTTNKNGTEKLGKIKFSDLAKDYLRANGKDTLYYTRDLGKTYNHIYCMNANGDRVQYKANNLFGVQFTIKVTEYACV